MITINRTTLLAAILLLFAGARSVAAEDIAPAGPHPIDSMGDTWTDAARNNREVPVKIYYPTDLKAPAAVVIVSHGLGGSCEGYAYLGRYLASQGYLAVHLTHAGSDTDALREAITGPDGAGAGAGLSAENIQAALKKIASNPANAINRPKDISFAIDKLIELNKTDGPLKGLIDADHIGIAGHSFGAYTALAVAGEHFFLKNGQELTATEPRIKAAVVMSPPGHNQEARQFAPIKIPIFLMTGTKDQSPLGTAGGPEDRQQIFEMLVNCPRYLLVFDGGDHMVFSGRPRALDVVQLPGMEGNASKDQEFQAFVKLSTGKFFDAWLRGDQDAKKWLSSDDGAKAILGKDGTWSAAGKDASGTN